MASQSPLVKAVAARLARYPQLDPAAVFAVAQQEGLGGGIGDGGHAFGPFQLNNAGGVLTGKFQGETPQQINQWAWSPAGIDYALNGIANVASGLKGPAAVTNIVGRFERPADIPGETSRALAALGQTPQGGANVGSVAPVAPQGLTAAPSGLPAAAPVSPRQQAAAQVSTLGKQLSLQLIGSAQSLLNGGTPNLSQLFAAAAGFQKAQKGLGKLLAPAAPRVNSGTPLSAPRSSPTAAAGYQKPQKPVAPLGSGTALAMKAGNTA